MYARKTDFDCVVEQKEEEENDPNYNESDILWYNLATAV